MRIYNAQPAPAPLPQFPGLHMEQTRGSADRPFSSILGVRYWSRTGSCFIRSVLKYFLFESGNTVTTTASPIASCTFTAARKLHPDEIPTPRPSVDASF